MERPILTPAQAQQAVAAGARLVDIRDADAYAREHIPGAVHIPLDQIAQMGQRPGPVIFHCKSGARTAAHSDALRAAAGGDCQILAGGIDGWRAAGLPTQVDRKQPIEVMRQVQIIAGALSLIGVALGFWVSPAFFALSACVGAGLSFAGITGWCGMALLLNRMPWNRAAA